MWHLNKNQIGNKATKEVQTIGDSALKTKKPISGLLFIA